MDIIKKYFPFSHVRKEVKALLISIAMYLVLAIVCGLILWLISKVPVINILCGIAGALVELYCLAGIVLSILCYIGVFDKK